MLGFVVNSHGSFAACVALDRVRAMPIAKKLLAQAAFAQTGLKSLSLFLFLFDLVAFVVFCNGVIHLGLLSHLPCSAVQRSWL